MNYVNSTAFAERLQKILPSLPNGITPEVLSKLCKDEPSQPFLKWFLANVKVDNVLSNEDVKLKNHIDLNNTWLKENVLEIKLKEAIKDCPELLNLIDSNYWNGKQSLADLAAEKELFDADAQYLKYLEDSIQKLKKQEEYIDNQLNQENSFLKQEEAKVKLANENYTSTLEDLDHKSRQFFIALEILSNSYIDANEKAGESCSWIQMPIELYIKQLDIYNDFLNSYVKRQFSVSLKDELKKNCENDASLLNNSVENVKLKELLSSQQNIFTAKMHEIIAKSEDESNKSLINYVTDIYDNGCLKAPSTSILARTEIAELTKTRNFLEENIYHLQEQKLVNTVQRFSRAKTVQVYEKEAEARLEKKRNRLVRLEKLCTYVKEYGHAFSTLLCMLFELQIHRINEIIRFVIDARHYLSMEYSLSSLRIESMQKLQNEFELTFLCPKIQTYKNAFCKMFTDIVAITDNKSDLQESIKYYGDLKNDNMSKLKILLDKKLTELMRNSTILEKKVVDLLYEERHKSSTLSFFAIPCEVQDRMDGTVKQVHSMKCKVDLIRNKLKNMIKEINECSFEREQLLIWQKFLTHPELLEARCKQLEDIVKCIKF